MRFDDDMPKPEFTTRPERFIVREKTRLYLAKQRDLWGVFTRVGIIGLFQTKEKALEAHPTAQEIL